MQKKAQKTLSTYSSLSVQERRARIAQLEKDAKQLHQDLLDMEKRLLLVLKEQKARNEQDSVKKIRRKLTSK